MKQLLLFFCLLFVGTQTLVSQNKKCTYTLRGKILDVETKQPIPFVNVKVNETGLFALTDEDGNFTINNQCSQNNTLSLSCIGYCESVCKHDCQHSDETHIYLKQKVSELKSVIINAHKSNQPGTEAIAKDVFKEEEIKESPTASLADLVSIKQGVSLASSGANVKLPIIHGLYGNRILILNNGLKHGFQNWGTDHAPEININAAKKITLIKGASGVRYGPEALAGAIVVEPNPMHLQEPFYAEVGIGSQTNGRGANAQAELGQGFRKWSYFVNGSYTKVGDRKAPNYNLTNTGKQEQAFGFGAHLHHKNWSYKLYYSYIGQNLGLLRSAVSSNVSSLGRSIEADKPSFIRPFSYDIIAPNQKVQHHLVKAKVNWWYSNQGKLSLVVGQQLNKRKEFDVRRKSYRPTMNLDLITNDIQLDWKHPKLGLLNGTIGIQSFSQNNDNNPGTGTTPFIPNYNINRYSAYVLEALDFGKQTVEFGLRLDTEYSNVRGRKISGAIFRDDYTNSNISASLGYINKQANNKTFRTNLGSAFRMPNMAELYSFGWSGYNLSYGLLRYQEDTKKGINTDDVLTLKESDIKPEMGYKFVNEYHVHQATSSHTYTLYAHYIKNYVYEKPAGPSRPPSGPALGFIFSQADSFFTGVDYTWEKDWSKNLASTLGASFLWSKNISNNEPLLNQPPIHISYKWKYRFKKLWKLDTSSISIKPNYTFQQFYAPRTISANSFIDGDVSIDLNSKIFDFKDAPQGYFLLDMDWKFSWKKLSGNISVQNALNTSYRSYLNSLRYFADDLGVNIRFGLQYKF